MHNDFHLKNILVWLPATRPVEHKRIYFRLGEETFAIEGYLVKLTDFGLSRLRVQGSNTIYDKSHPAFRVFVRTNDVQNAIESLGKIKIDANTW